MVEHNHSRPLSVRNYLLAALPDDNLAQLLPKFTPVALPLRQVLYLPDVPIEFVYFVEAGMISLVAGLPEGSQDEVGVIGREGMLGTPLVAGVETAFTEAIVQMEGTALRMGAMAFAQELTDNPPLKALLLRFSETVHAQATQLASCNGRHALEPRLARWLLMAHDRADSDNLDLTQEFLAIMLGAHRPSVTVTAGILQRAGLIRYFNGTITMLDRKGMEAAACGCYAAVQSRYAQLLGKTPPDVLGKTDSFI